MEFGRRRALADGPTQRVAGGDGVPGDRQVEGERGPHAEYAVDGEVGIQQGAQLAADGEPKPRSAVRPCRGVVRLLERLEDRLETCGVDADPRVLDLQASWRPLLFQPNPDRHAPLARELEGVGDQVHEDLAEAEGIGRDDERP